MLTLTIVTASLMAACNTTPIANKIDTQKALGVLEISLDSAGVSSVKFLNNQTRAVTFRENDAVFGAGTTQVISSTSSAFDYLVATFPVSHAAASATAFDNLTLYALAKTGNVGSTAIKSIADFGGVTNAIEQTRLAKLIVLVHAVTTDGSGNVVTDNTKADFQAFTTAEVTAATTAAGSSIAGTDNILNYGFSARCATGCTPNSRNIPTNGTGSVSIALRVPKAAASTVYKFVMDFVVLNETVSRVTKGIYPNETVAQAETRGASVGATRLMQMVFGQTVFAGALALDQVRDVQTSSLGASIKALGIGRITAGFDHSCGLTASGKAYCWGNNNYGQLGDNTNNISSVPVEVYYNTSRYASISAGGGHTCAVPISGTTDYCWGRNDFGQLGNYSTINKNYPVAVALSDFVSISAGFTHTCGVTSSGTGYCWGSNSSGRLGINSTTDSKVPSAVSGSLTFEGISGGSGHTCGFTSSGASYCWGDNQNGQLGIGFSGGYAPAPFAVVGGQTFTSVNSGQFHTCGLTSTGTAYCWGNNGTGRLGNNSTTDSSVPFGVDNTNFGL